MPRMTEAERNMSDIYCYTRRPGQSRDFITVPMALLQEAEASCPDGDAKTLLRAMLMYGRIT